MAYGLGMIITTAVRILATVFKWNLPKAIWSGQEVQLWFLRSVPRPSAAFCLPLTSRG